MITLNSERGLVQIENWTEIEARPGFIKDLNPTDHKLKEIIGRYVFGERIRCGLSNCHTPHAKGYIVVTEDGHETNIGKDCGKTYFGVDFEILSNRFDRDLAASQNRETLATFSFHLDELESRIWSQRTAERGGDWVYKNTRPLLAAGRGCPTPVVRRLADMIRSRSSIVTAERRATEEEIAAMEVREGRELRRPQFVSEAIGQVSGMEALYPENDLRELLVLDLGAHISEFREINIEDLTHTGLKRWVKWTAGVEATLEQATTVIASGQALLSRDNLNILLQTLTDPADKTGFRAFLRSLSARRDTGGSDVETGVTGVDGVDHAAHARR